jgi:hypothetical protein
VQRRTGRLKKPVPQSEIRYCIRRPEVVSFKRSNQKSIPVVENIIPDISGCFELKIMFKKILECLPICSVVEPGSYSPRLLRERFMEGRKPDLFYEIPRYNSIERGHRNLPAVFLGSARLPIMRSALGMWSYKQWLNVA